MDDIKGIRYGFRGFFEQEGELRQPIKLTSDLVETIHLEGGSILGSSRGGSDTSDIVDAIADMDLDFLFVIGGNGSHAGALAIDNMCRERNMPTAVGRGDQGDPVRRDRGQVRVQRRRFGSSHGPAVGVHRHARRAGVGRG